MDFRILGPLEVGGERGAVALVGIKPRAILAVLLLHANQPVSAERLAVALWGEEAPAGATKTVHVYVSRLRKALRDPEAIETTPAGYRLRVRPDELDAERFARGVEAGRRALGAGLPEQGAGLLREALGLWRGPPLAELEFEPFAQAEIARLEEERLVALELRLEADLGVGRHRALVSELRQLLAEHPTRERLSALLMLALYRSGRQAESLEVYRESRRTLVEEAGVEPGAELQRLHEAVLGQDGSLDLPAGELPSALDPEQAPPLVGRGAELARLREHWRHARRGSGCVVAVCGVEGIGKTRLVAELAGEAHRAGGVVRRVAGRGPPGVVLAVLGGLPATERPTLVVFDDADAGAAEAWAALRAVAPQLTGVPVLLVVCAREMLTSVGARDRLVLGSLGAEDVRALAAGRDVPPEWLLERSQGVPRRMHELVSRWAQDQALERVDRAAERTAVDRAALRATEAELAGGVIELQAARESTESAREDDAPVSCPFKGLAFFDVADAPYFFGRERVVAELVARLVGASLVGVLGPSGSGKSSVVRAGLLPELAGGVLPGSAGWAQAIMRPGEHPLDELARVTGGIGGDRRQVLVVDQFEETFTACRDEQEREAFVGELVADRGDRIVVLAIRADHYGRCASYPRLAQQLTAYHVLVGAMRHDELRRAVERPARRAGLRVEAQLADALVSDVEHEPGALPMLSTALLELWQRREGRRLRLATYEAAGGVRGAVARHAEAAFARLDRAQQAVARSVLLRLAAEGPGGGIERRRVALAEFDGERDEDVARVLGVLSDQRLLTVSAGAVEVAHEALLREWPRLRGWLEQDAEGRRLHRHLADAAREWDEHGHDDGDLYRGARLASALEWRASHEPDLNHSERAYLDAGHAAQQHELHATRLRRRRAVTFVISLLVVIAGISTILAVRGIQRARFEQRAAASRALATRALAHLPDNVALTGLLSLEAYRREPTVEARTAVLSVLPALSGYRRLGRPLAHDNAVGFVAISANGTRLISVTSDGTISRWDLTTHRRIGPPVSTRMGSVNDLAISPDGRLAASAGADHTLRLWDTATGRQHGEPLERHDGDLWRVAFSPDGRTLAGGDNGNSTRGVTPTETGEVRLWDVATGLPRGRPIKTTPHAVNRVNFSPDGKRIAIIAGGHLRLWDLAAHRFLNPPPVDPNAQLFGVIAFGDKTLATASSDSGSPAVQLWDPHTGRPSGRPLPGRMGAVTGLALSPDGRTLASGGEDATVRLWDVATHRPIGALMTDTDRPASAEKVGRVAGVLSVAFSPRGGILASADALGAVQLWNTRPARPLSRSLPAQAGWIHGLAFAPDGATLAAGDIDGSARLWDTRTGRLHGPALEQPGSLLGVVLSPDGQTLAAAGATGLRLWDTRAHRPLGPPLEGHAGPVKAVAFSPDGDTLASGGDDGTVRLWNADTQQPLGPPLDAHAGAVNGVAFAPDGKTLAAAGQDGAVRLWNTRERRPASSPLQGSAAFVDAVAFSPDGHTLASAGQDGSVWLWDVSTHRPLGAPLTGHTDVADALSFSPDGSLLATASADHTVRLWDVRTRRALGQPLDAHAGWVSAVAFSPRGDQLASAGEDGTVHLWDPILWSHDPHALQQRLCHVIQRNLTHTEWAVFQPDQPYHQTCPKTR